MSIGSAASLVEALQQLPVLDASSIAELPALGDAFSDPNAFAKELVRRGWLTPFQADILIQRRGHELVRGSFVLLEKLNDTPTPRTFKARHQPTKRTVALKIVSSELLSDPEVCARFYREVQVASRIAHPNVAQPIEVAREGDDHAVALEFVEGRDFGKLVQANGPLPTPRACDYVRQIALALQHVHERGLIHRAIKPSNLVLAASAENPETVKVLGLGLARGLRAEERLGPYAAPEQAVDFHGVDIRADIFSLGAVFFYLLTGSPSARAGAPDVKGLRADLSLVLLRMLACKAEDRFQSPAEVAAALAPLIAPAPPGATLNAESALAGETVDAFVGGSMTHLAEYAAPRLGGLSGELPVVTPPVELAQPARIERPLQTKALPRWPMALGALALALALGFLVWLVAVAALPWGDDSPPPKPQTAPAAP